MTTPQAARAGKPSFDQAMAMAEAAIRKNGGSPPPAAAEHAKAAPPAPNAKGRGKPAPRPMVWRYVFAYVGSAALLAYALHQMP
jgi:hypothetical protein